MSKIEEHTKKKRVIANNRRRLQVLREKKALHGYGTSPEILLEIEEIEKEIEELETELRNNTAGLIIVIKVSEDTSPHLVIEMYNAQSHCLACGEIRDVR